ncbi:vWA domain-containing protein [Stigmatella aurantiaca]|uniref:von Willebrand factor type A domain protein n=2 Tax=Stigmatella aurantiaca (strain DW4/3-1) TaxID=378806 RepID=E3FWM0_STIAD|nr:von Willebrand factor type A domain-containing protein [Stigmatella aurantiaca]ADO68533.1 von Willebrand factor type A domain protein [Stigmatella aurantiaca DW4/3-1]
MSLTIQKLARAALSAVLLLTLTASCALAPPPRPKAEPGTDPDDYALEEMVVVGRADSSETRAPPRPPPKKEKAAEFSRVAVVNGKPFADMYFKHYGVNPTIDTEEENVSTFSVDVDSASYALARAYLSRNHLPAEEAIRVEEFVNAFRYDYQDPGAEPFGVQVEAFPSPNRQGYHVLHVGLQGQKVSAAERLPAHLVFTIDVSGSMNMENRLELVKRSLAMLVEKLDSRDTLAIVVYGDTARTVLEPTRIMDRSRILEAINALHPEGSTNVQAGLQVAYAIAASQVREGATSRVILCSDGVANNGITQADSIFQSVKAYAQQGVRLTTVGFGMGNYNDELMERLSHVGDGQYAYVDALPEARRIFIEQFTGTLQLIARDVKVQVEFDPARVSRYRLIGFENRLLNKEDFTNDRVDAGDIGAGHTVTALYEVKFREGQAHGPSPFATLRIRYKDPSTRLEAGQSREVQEALPTSVVRYSLEDASGPAQLSAVVALFAEKLRGSYWVRNLTYHHLMRLWQQLPEHIRTREEVSELRQLIQQARSLDGRLDKFEKESPVATMDFDHVPVVR